MTISQIGYNQNSMLAFLKYLMIVYKIWGINFADIYVCMFVTIKKVQLFWLIMKWLEIANVILSLVLDDIFVKEIQWIIADNDSI